MLTETELAVRAVAGEEGSSRQRGRYLEGTRAVWDRPVGYGVLSLRASPLAGDHVMHIDFFPFSQNRHGLFW